MATWATPGSLFSAIMSPTTNTSGWPGSGEVGLDRDPAGAVDLGAGLLGELPAERAGLHAGGPDLGDAARSAREPAVGRP